MKIINITLHAINNYGSVFQALATETIFRQLGCECQTVDYVCETANLNSVSRILKYGGPGMKMKLKILVSFLFFRNGGRLAKQLENFRQRHLHFTPYSYRSDKDLETNCPDADIYCTGSDQTWNTVCQGGIPRSYFLHFVPDSKRKISFSASFGVEKLPDKDKKEVKQLLSRYKAISVREATGIDILKDLGYQGTLVLDPTLAVGNELWDSLASPRILTEDYILAYQLNHSIQYVRYVNEVAKRKGLKVVHVRSRKEYGMLNSIWMGDCSPEELLSLFKNASFVVTDSFHATVFATIFHRQFVDIYPPKYSTRLESFLQLIGLESQHVADFSDYSKLDNVIEYHRVDDILNSMRVKTVEYLKSAIYG